MSKKLTVIALSLLVALAGCQKEDKVSIQARSTYVSPEADGQFVSVTATGAWKLTLEYPSGTTPWASVNPSEGTGSASDIRFKYEANTLEEARQVTLVLTPAKGTPAREVITQGAKAEEAVHGSYGYDVAPMDWLELPATKAGDGREVLVHAMDGGKYLGRDKSGTRNWSCDWDYEEHLSLWVAYPLNNSLAGKGKFDYVWGFDPLLPASIQPDITARSYGGKDFSGGNWNRGHQMPRADRQTSQKAVASTCYPTNMTPQDGSFNSGIWVTLEGKVRSFASQADTIYVVTGCLFDKSTRYSSKNSGFSVKIPTHYFKALLYKGSSSYAKDTEGYMMAGFIFEHEKSYPTNASLKDYRMSIDQLEEQTGIDFFPNLEKRNKALSQQLEAAQPNGFWN